jgi:aminoglycoside phosphotransferase (APT) family kinase protein
MRMALQAAFFGPDGGRWTIAGCKIEETLYKPGRSCVLVYRLVLADARGAVRQQLVCARLCRSREAGDAQAQVAAQAASSAMRPVAYLPALRMIAWAFPNDPVLKRLPDMLDSSLMQLLLPRRLPALDLCGANRLRDIQADVLHYRAQRTCMLRYRLDIENRASGQVSPFTVYGKIYGSADSAEVFRVMEQLHEHSPRFPTAIPLGYDAELNAVWQSHLDGTPLDLEQSTPAQCHGVMERIANCVAAFHLSAVDSVHVATIEQILSQLAKTAAVVAGTHPWLGKRLATLVRHLTARTAEIDFSNVPATPVHRDLKLANFLLERDRAALIDLDEIALGDPLIDIGSFVAGFSAHALLLGWEASAVDAVLQRFLRHYAAQVNWPVLGERLDWYIAASFIYESIHRGVRRWDMQRLRAIPRWIAAAERYAYAASEQVTAATQ